MTSAQHTATSVEPVHFAEAMTALASGVVLVTCRFVGRPWGMTATAFASVSADPPTVLVSVASATVSARAIEDSGAFGVSMLSRTQGHVAEYGAARRAAKFLDALIEPRDRTSSSPAVANALAHLDCEVVQAVRTADHTIFVAEVLAARRRHGDPLLYHDRGYRTLSDPERTLKCLSS
jgi:flavin reductase (DIM6/NTAB) family NADH-FMN oxidoreductase RutF